MKKLEGKKTYILVAIGIAYLIGGGLGWWVMEKEVLVGLGMGQIATLRSGIKKK